MSGLRRLFQSARERNSLTWREIYWQGGLYASQSGKLTVGQKGCFFSQLVHWLNSICCAICADRDGYSQVCVFPAGFGSNFWIMVGSASGPGSTFMAFLGSARVRVPLSNKIRVRVGSVQHIYGSLRVRVRIFGPVKTSTAGHHRLHENTAPSCLPLHLLLFPDPSRGSTRSGCWSVSSTAVMI